jgi:NADH-quinone oxidoreductase subunit G
VRRAPALQKTRDAQVPAARINPATITRLGLDDGGAVRVRQGGEALLKVVADAGVPEGCVRVAAAHPATSMLGPMFGPVAADPV